MFGSLVTPHANFHPLPALPSSSLLSLNVGLDELCEFGYTLWLFTFSDLKTILIPTFVFGTAAATPSSTTHMLLRAVWIWLHLLQFCISNQCLSPDEDGTNKPWRPIPARRISTAAARRLRWAMLAVCLAVSAQYGVGLASAVLMLATLAHNELGMDARWLPRNVCNAVGYAAFNAGATYVRRSGAEHCGPRAMAVPAQVLNALVILTTVQAQDFQDAEGDRAVGRKTLPIIAPAASRWAMMFLLPAWSAFLSLYWRTSTVHGAVLLAFGITVASRFVFRRSAPADRLSYRIYNVRPVDFHPTI
ncbi:UbiA prenyltransferase family-domain-containing protein [Trametes elegans]|nr:UbiA prenyltransferase family-domain-containing protein [Trametes elegans]